MTRRILLMLLVAALPGFGRAQANDSLVLESLVPSNGVVDGLSAREASRHGHLDASNSVQADLRYQLESSERGAINIKLQTPARQFVEINNPIHRGTGRIRPRFTVLCEPGSPREQLVQRISFTLAAVDEQGHWLRTLTSVDRAVSYRFRCPTSDQEGLAALPPHAFAVDMPSGQVRPPTSYETRPVARRDPSDLPLRPAAHN